VEKDEPVNHLYAIDGRYFYAGVIVNDDVIINAAPILKWSVGWNFKDFTGYCEKKKWGVVDAEIHRTGS
jgi:hypothetical protein